MWVHLPNGHHIRITRCVKLILDLFLSSSQGLDFVTAECGGYPISWKLIAPGLMLYLSLLLNAFDVEYGFMLFFSSSSNKGEAGKRRWLWHISDIL